MVLDLKNDKALLVRKVSVSVLAAVSALVLVASLSYAQDAQMPSLPGDVAEEQVPPAFIDQDAPKEEPAKAIDEVDVTAKEGEIPATPEEKKLVPAKAMGAAAQNAANAAQAQPQNPAQESAQADGASVDILEKYAAQTQEASGDDSLPAVGDDMMVGIDPALESGNAGMSMDAGLMEPKSPEELQEEIRSEAFDAAITGLFPLEPDQIKELVKRHDAVQEAVKTPPHKAPTPEISVQNVSLDPGVMPITIKTAVGNVTTLNMLDATGAPWPVQDVTWAGDFEVIEPEQGGHIIRITPMSDYARGNVVIRMLTLKTPLTMTIETNRDVVQYRVDARIPEMGPFAKAPLMQGGKSLVAGSTDLTAILDGVMPGGMKKLNVSGVDGRTTAYAMGDTTYVRTPLTLLSPAWQSSVSSADGMNVYALTSAPVLLLSDEGNFQRATISDKEELLDE